MIIKRKSSKFCIYCIVILLIGDDDEDDDVERDGDDVEDLEIDSDFESESNINNDSEIKMEYWYDCFKWLIGFVEYDLIVFGCFNCYIIVIRFFLDLVMEFYSLWDMYIVYVIFVFYCYY